jgi:5'-deoxynucleotidase YfbR-like HD superfamily hydrolase
VEVGEMGSGSLVSFLLSSVFPYGEELRSGWPDREVMSRLQSGLEHGAALGLAAFYVNIAQRRGLDNATLLGMSIVHDLHEAVTKDQSPSQIYPMGRTRRAKKKFWETVGERIDWLRWEALSSGSDRKAMGKLTRPMDRNARVLLRRWWVEYHQGKSPEARLLRQLHPIVDCAKGVAYQMDPKNKGMLSINSFFTEAQVVVVDPLLKPFLDELEILRELVSGATDHQ